MVLDWTTGFYLSYTLLLKLLVLLTVDSDHE